MLEANYKFQGRSIERRVFGLDSGGYTKGYGVVYNPTSTDVSAVTVQDLARMKYVNNPTTTLNKYFAGVVAESKSSAGQITILEPGSDGLIYVDETSAAAGTIVYCDCGNNAGQFKSSYGYGKGRGAALLLETVDAVGLYHAYLFDGQEDLGLYQELVTGASGAVTITKEGVTSIDSSAATGGLTATLADGTYFGQKKGYYVTAVHGTPQDLVVTVTSGLQNDGSNTALATITLNAVGEYAFLEWLGTEWQLISYKGATLA